MLRYFLRLVESYLFIAVASIALGLFFPEAFSRLGPYTTLFLQVIFFLSSLKLETSELLRAGKQWKTFLAANALILFALPVAVYLVATPLVPDLSFALVLLAAMPVGMSLPLMVDVIAGDRSLALLLTISSSLLILFVFFVAIHLFSHITFHRKPYKEQVTIAAAATFMNFTLAIYLASVYDFPPAVVLTLVLSIIPWAILLIPFKWTTDWMRGRGWVE